ncbi:MAG: putative sulfate/molybdate transporter [Haloferacaceae archaeon]
MAYSVSNRGSRGVSISAGEATGALGDSVTVLPILVGLGALTDVSLPHALLWFGVFQVAWGLVYGLPLSVEPMKALAGLAIAGALTLGELVAGGLAAGAVLLVAGRTGLLSRVAARVGDPVVRGVQLAVALVLARSALDLALAAPRLALAAAVVAGAVVAVTDRRAAPLVVLAGGAAFAVARAGVPAPTLPELAAFPGAAPALTPDAASGVAGQLAMTVGNAAVATAALCADYFDADVSPDDLAGSMGAMNLVAVPLGGLPMCHGSGGLAGKYAFGARSGGANLLLGAGYLALATVAGLVVAFPTAVLGVLLGLVALQLAAAARRSDALLLTAAVGAVGLLANVGVAFLLGVAACAARDRWTDRGADRGATDPTP